MADQVIPPAEVSTAKIKEVFDSAFINATVSENNQVLITEEGIKTFVAVEADKQILKYTLLFGVRQGAKLQDQLEFVNEVNKNIVFVRAWSFGNGFVFDYSLPYDGGLPPKQIVSAYRWLKKTTLGGIQQHNRKNVVG